MYFEKKSGKKIVRKDKVGELTMNDSFESQTFSDEEGNETYVAELKPYPHYVCKALSSIVCKDNSNSAT
jgi:hypothetical protein